MASAGGAAVGEVGAEDAATGDGAGEEAAAHPPRSAASDARTEALHMSFGSGEIYGEG
jgi:hypothetical protein